MARGKAFLGLPWAPRWGLLLKMRLGGGGVSKHRGVESSDDGRWMDVLVVFGAYRGENSRGHQPNASIALVDTLWDDAGTGAVPLPSWLVAQTATVCFRAMFCRKLAGLDGEPAGWCVLARTRALVGRASWRACELASCRGGSIWSTLGRSILGRGKRPDCRLPVSHPSPERYNLHIHV